MSNTAANWAIADNDGIVDRFSTELEATEALQQGSYPPFSYVTYSPEPVGIFDCRVCRDIQ